MIPWEPNIYESKKILLDCDIEGSEQLVETLFVKGQAFQYVTLFQEVFYWRKANHIHSWFVENCQDGIDECQLSEVTKEQLETLVESCKKVVSAKNTKTRKEVLPTAGGFFFGGTDYDEYYYEICQEIINQFETIIENINFDEEIVFYQSSW